MSSVDGQEPWRPRPLPDTPNCDGRPVWEPPIFDYSDMIDPEENEKKRKAVLKFTEGDVVRATQIMDYVDEADLLTVYRHWSQDMALEEPGWFYEDLEKKLSHDLRELVLENWYARVVISQDAGSTEWVARTLSFHGWLSALERAERPHALRRQLQNHYETIDWEMNQDKKMAAIKIQQMKSITTESEQSAWLKVFEERKIPFVFNEAVEWGNGLYSGRLSVSGCLNPGSRGFWAVTEAMLSLLLQIPGKYVSFVPLVFRILRATKNTPADSQDQNETVSEPDDELD